MLGVPPHDPQREARFAPRNPRRPMDARTTRRSSCRLLPWTTSALLLGLGSCYRTGVPGFSHPIPPPPRAEAAQAGFARYYDDNFSQDADSGDLVVFTFSRPVTLATSSPDGIVAALSADFGLGAMLVPGPRPHEVAVRLGADPQLKTRQPYDPGSGDSHPSGAIEVAASLPPGSIVTTEGGADAIGGGVPLDVVPGYREWFAPTAAPATVVACGDVDGDGKQDLVLGHALGGFSVLRGNGSGGFDELFAGGDAPVTALALADLDGDAHLDLAVGTSESDEIWLGDGDGGFARTAQSLGGSETRAIAATDVERDGDLDLIVAGAGSLVGFCNDGSAEFKVFLIESSAAPAHAVVALDADRDGWSDLLVARDAGLELFLGDGSGRFGKEATLGADASRSIAVGDVDGDGRLDAVSGGSARSVLWLGDGRGGFVESAELGADLGTRVVLLVDLDADGRLDLVQSDAQGLRTFVQDSAGSLTDTGELLEAGGATGLAAADLDRDGDPDLVAASESGAGNTLWVSPLAGTWGGTRFRNQLLDLGSGTTFDLAAADVDRDGDLDVLTANNYRVEIFENLGTGQFSKPLVVLETPEARVLDLELGDVDLDGDDDVLMAVLGRAPMLWLNDGAGHFGAALPPGAGPPYTELSALALGDIDGDGDLDLVRGRQKDAADDILDNLGFDDQGRWLGFGEPRLLTDAGVPFAAHTGALALADFDRDGDLDLVAAYGKHTANRWWKNGGSGDFVLQDQLLEARSGPRGARAVTLGDLDRDGLVDVIVGGTGGEVVFLNQGDGKFLVYDDLVPDSDTYAVSLADVDGDALLDLAVGNDREQGLQLRRNEGAGRLSALPWIRLNHRSVRALLTADFDGDGDIDVLSGNVDEVPNQLWLNR